MTPRKSSFIPSYPDKVVELKHGDYCSLLFYFFFFFSVNHLLGVIGGYWGLLASTVQAGPLFPFLFENKKKVLEF